jgi:GAF domain-containing protein
LALVNSDGTAYRLQILLETRRDFSKDPVESIPIERGIPGIVIQSGRMRFFPDVTTANDKPPVSDDALEGGSIRSVLSLPLTAYSKVLGAITFGSTHENAFKEDDVKVAQSFAVHLALAIDRWRQSQELEARNNDLTEALEQQTATSEVLHVISSSPTDVQPVFDMIAESAKRLCHGQFCAVFRFDGERLHFVGHCGLTPAGLEAYRQTYPKAANRETAIGRAVLSRGIAHIPDVEADSEFVYGAAAQAMKYRSIVGVPILREDRPIGAITVARSDPEPFPDKQIEILKQARCCT